MRAGIGLSLLMWLGAGVFCGYLTGCALMGPDFAMVGTTDGIRAFTDHEAAVASVGTHPEHFYSFRKLQTTEETARMGQPGALSRIFGRGGEQK